MDKEGQSWEIQCWEEAGKGLAVADPHQLFATAPPASLTPTIRCEGLRIRTKHTSRAWRDNATVTGQQK